MVANFPALVTALALVLYVAVFMAAGRARAQYNIKAPAITGPPEFERAFRVQQNTVEQLILFLPALWLFTTYVSAFWAGILGLVWIAGRTYYAFCYYRDPETRGPGFITAMAASFVLLLGGLIGVVAALT